MMLEPEKLQNRGKQGWPDAGKGTGHKGDKKVGRIKGRRGNDSSEEEYMPRPVVDTSMGEMPDGALSSDKEGVADRAEVDEISKALDQNLDM